MASWRDTSGYGGREIQAAMIARAWLSGPQQITQGATVAELHEDGSLQVLHHGTNEWACFPGNENQIGNVPMCANPMGLQWVMDISEWKPA
ncbi:hypothetical protein MMC17_005497 [Xylographa soralifera]|nr:hypothetical protein [Xylographa soralifera]